MGILNHSPFSNLVALYNFKRLKGFINNNKNTRADVDHTIFTETFTNVHA